MTREPMKPVSVRFPVALWKAALEKADKNGDILAEIIREAVKTYVKEK